MLRRRCVISAPGCGGPAAAHAACDVSRPCQAPVLHPRTQGLRYGQYLIAETVVTLTPAAAIVLVVIGSFVLSDMAPVLFRQVFVKPSELQLEKPYIERNIALTRQAYNLDQIAAQPFAAEQKLTFKTLEANKATIENIRLWDWLPANKHRSGTPGCVRPTG
jgi:hypothetical protein